MFVFFHLGVCRHCCSALLILWGYFVFYPKPSSSGTFYFQQMLLKGCFAFKKEYEGTREGQIGLSWAPFCSENLPSNFIETLWLNPLQCHPPQSSPTARAGGSCFPCPEPGAALNTIHYSATRFHCRFGSLLRYKGYSAHNCLGIICLFIAHHLHFLEIFSKVVLGTVDIIIKHSIHIEKSPVLVSFLQSEEWISGQDEVDV